MSENSSKSTDNGFIVIYSEDPEPFRQQTQSKVCGFFTDMQEVFSYLKTIGEPNDVKDYTSAPQDNGAAYRIYLEREPAYRDPYCGYYEVFSCTANVPLWVPSAS